MANWTNQVQPYGENHTPLLAGLSSIDGLSTVPIAVDPATGSILTSGGSTASSVAINDGVTTTRKASVLNLTDSKPLATALVDGNGDQITSFGGGTQYTDGGSPPLHPVGTMPIYNNGGTWSQVSTSNGLPIQVIGTPAVTVSGVATASNQTGGSQKTQIVDGSGNVIGATNNALDINIKSGNPTTIAVTNTGTFAVQAVLGTETTKVIGTVRAADGAGNLLTSNSTTYTAKFGLDGNLLGTLGTAFSTAGKIDIKGADGDVFVRNATAANLNMTEANSGSIKTDLDTLSGVVTSARAAVNPISGQAGVSASAGAVDATTQRVINANNAGKTVVSKGGSASLNGDNTLVSAGTNKLKVFSYTLTTVSTTALTVKITDGVSGTVLWQAVLQAPSGANVGATATVMPPAYLFATSTATALVMNLSSANAVNYSLSYYDEA